jgi:hypothetical protein
MRLRAGAAIVAGLAVSTAILAQGPRIDGKWEVTTEMEMPGMPMKMPPAVSTQCITKEEAADPQKAVPKGRVGRGGDDPNCKVADYKIDGNKVTYTMKCEGAQPMTMTGEMIYGDNTYTSTQKMNMGGRETMTMKSTAKRLGDCTK